MAPPHLGLPRIVGRRITDQRHDRRHRECGIGDRVLDERVTPSLDEPGVEAAVAHIVVGEQPAQERHVRDHAEHLG